MKKFLWMTVAVFTTATIMVACSNTGTTTSGTVDPNLGCASGATFYNGNCVGANGMVVSTGIAFNANNFYNRSVTITNMGVYEQFLKEAMMICSQSSYNIGQSSCSSYDNGAISISLQTTGVSASAARLTVQVAPTMQYFNLSFGYTNYGIAYNPLPLNMTVSLINNSQGIEARSYGATGTYAVNKLIQLIIPNQTLASGYLDYQLAYNGTGGGVFATGRMILCSDSSCSSL